MVYLLGPTSVNCWYDITTADGTEHKVLAENTWGHGFFVVEEQNMKHRKAHWLCRMLAIVLQRSMRPQRESCPCRRGCFLEGSGRVFFDNLLLTFSAFPVVE